MNAAAAHFGRREILGNNAGALRPNRFGYPNSPRDTDTQAQKEIVNTPSVQRDL